MLEAQYMLLIKCIMQSTRKQVGIDTQEPGTKLNVAPQKGVEYVVLGLVVITEVLPEWVTTTRLVNTWPLWKLEQISYRRINTLFARATTSSHKYSLSR